MATHSLNTWLVVWLLSLLLWGPVAQGQVEPHRDRPAGVDRSGDPLPRGAVARCGTVRLRPIAHVCCAFSPDGMLLATGEEGRLGLWDLRTGKEIHSFAMPGVDAVAEI